MLPKKNDKHAHKYKNEVKNQKNKIKKAKVTKFSPMQLRIIEVMKYLTSEAKPYVSEILIKNKINSYYQAYNRSFSNQVIKSQLTRMVNDDIICKKRNSYAILASLEQINQIIKNS